MVKQRLSSIDAKAAIDEVRRAAVGLRLSNVYDLSPRVYLLKFAQGEKKVYVLFESGVRLHVTTFAREKPKVPSQFTLKLRKHVRSWRLEEVSQIGTDRVVDLRFGSGDQAHHFVLELYGQGNFFLTDAKYTILMLLRSAKSEDVRLAVRETYQIEHAKHFESKTKEEIVQALDVAKDSDTLRASLPISFYGSLLADHLLATCGLNPLERKSVWRDDIASIADCVHSVFEEINALIAGDIVGGGVLLKIGSSAAVHAARQAEAAAAANGAQPSRSPLPEDDDDLDEAATMKATAPGSSTPAHATAGVSSSVLPLPSNPVEAPDEFWPACVEKFLDRSKIVAIERTRTFSEAVDRCFRSSEQEKITQHNAKKEQVVLTKRDKFLRDHQRRIEGLTQEQEKHRQLAELLEMHADEVDAAINLVNDVLATGISWDHLASLIRLRQSEGTHPVANIIHELKLHKNTISLLLSSDFDADDEVEDADVEPEIVDVDLSLTALGNVAKYHSQKKTVGKKLTKTLEATEMAAEAAGKKGERVAKKVVERKDIVQIRQPLWFEKFNWFVTSHGHLVVAAHDPMQADLLFRKYLGPGDIFVHGDATGCQPAIVKNPTFGKVPMPSIEEAGILCIARSEAWRKSPVSAWWCLATQVSKKTPQGDYLGAGQFSVRGVKNYMPAMQLQLSVAVLFKTNRARPTREAGGVSHVNVSDLWTEQYQQQQQGLRQQQLEPPQPQHGVSGTGRSGASNASSMAVPDTSPERQASGDTVGDTQSPTQPREAADFPDAASGGGAPLAAQLHLRQQQQAAMEKRNKLRHLGRGQGQGAATTPGALQVVPGQLPAATQPSAGETAEAKPLQHHQLAAVHHTRLKKITKKYGSQDEEDRQRAMAVLGNQASKVHQVLHQQQQQQPADPSPRHQDPSPVASSVASPPLLQPPSPVPATTSAPPYSDVEDIQSQPPQSVATEDEGATMAPGDAAVPFLDGAPSLSPDGDVVVDDVFVVCAPYAAVRHYAFKARIQPGTDKKGQAADEILHALGKLLSSTFPAAADAFKQVSKEAVIAQLPGPLKVHIGDLTASSTATGTAGGVAGHSMNGAGGEDPNLSVRQKQKLKKEEQERQLMEKLRAERRARLESRGRGTGGSETSAIAA